MFSGFRRATSQVMTERKSDTGACINFVLYVLLVLWVLDVLYVLWLSARNFADYERKSDTRACLCSLALISSRSRMPASLRTAKELLRRCSSMIAGECDG